MLFNWLTTSLHKRDHGVMIAPKTNWNLTNSCPSSGDWSVTEVNNATYSLVPLEYYMADGESCKASYVFEGSQV